MPRNYNVLSCDGGGIRGLITARLLAGLPVDNLANTRVYAGTSTGGILAIGLAAGLPISTLVDLYGGQCSTIFSQTPAASDDQIYQYLVRYTGSSVGADAIQALIWSGLIPRTLFSAKWSNASLKSQVASVLGPNATTTFAELTTKLFVTAYRLDDGQGRWSPMAIDNLGGTPADSTLVDAAMATSAAPTYFPPYLHPTLGYCVDGGTFANDPSMFVLSRLLQSGVSPDCIRFLSVGTGATQDGVPSAYFGTVAPALWGPIQYLFPVQPPASVPPQTLISLLMDGSSQIDNRQASEVLPNGNFRRVQVPLPGPIPLDDCSNVGALETIAADFMRRPEWQEVTRWVTENFV